MADVNRLVAFDLDDTLYKERDYWFSGMRYVVEHIHKLGMDCGNSRFEIAESHLAEANVFGSIIKHYNLPVESKDSLIWLYRNHQPRIVLPDASRETLAWCYNQGFDVAIITDGRSVTQRSKITALGLTKYQCFVSEEVGAEKPSRLSFEKAAQGRNPAHCTYVADNISKDFIAPNSMGWLTIGLKNNGLNVVREIRSGEVQSHAHPKYWVSDLSEIAGLIT